MKKLFRFYYKGLKEGYALDFKNAVKLINKNYPQCKSESVVSLNITFIE